jgi:pantoate--beta-alanine ligase
MEIIRTVRDLREYRFTTQQKNQSVGFVPTMGALHKGHESLIQQAKKEKDICIVSIFVNPTQFNDPKDFKKYPKTEAADIEVLKRNNCDAVFIPSVEEVYPEPQQAWDYKIGYLDTILEGAFRPNHFKGVTQVVYFLLDILQPHAAYFGLKDYQQYLVIKEMIDTLKMKVDIIGCPTIRDFSGLALSSRNQLLDKDGLYKAQQINRILFEIRNEYYYRNREKLEHKALELLAEWVESVDYFVIKNADTLTPIHSPDEKAIALLAVKVNGIRLIDNLILN